MLLTSLKSMLPSSIGSFLGILGLPRIPRSFWKGLENFQVLGTCRFHSPCSGSNQPAELTIVRPVAVPCLAGQPVKPWAVSPLSLDCCYTTGLASKLPTLPWPGASFPQFLLC